MMSAIDTIDTLVPAPAAQTGSPRKTGTRMRAHAELTTELRSRSSGPAYSCVSKLRSEAPLTLRMTRAKGPEPWVQPGADVVRVAVTAGAAGPVGGDELALTVMVGAFSTLMLSEISPTLLLPGPHGEQSCTRVRIHVAKGGTLIWAPEPMIAARGCNHLNDVAVDLDIGARLFMREEVLLGRYGEASGRVMQRVSVRLAGKALYRQDLHVGTDDAGTPAVLGEHRAVGSTVIVEPSWVDEPPQVHHLAGEVAVLPLAGPAVLITALGSDNLMLRHHLTAGLTTLGFPWAPEALTATP